MNPNPRCEEDRFSCLVKSFLTEVQTAGGVDHAAPALGLSMQSSISINLNVAVFPSPAQKIGKD